MRTTFLVMIAVLAAVLLVSATVWEGVGDVSAPRDLPRAYSIATNSFPRNTVVDITNLENGKMVRVVVISTLETTGLLATLSRNAADAIELRRDSTCRIRMTLSSDSARGTPSPQYELGPIDSAGNALASAAEEAAPAAAESVAAASRPAPVNNAATTTSKPTVTTASRPAPTESAVATNRPTPTESVVATNRPTPTESAVATSRPAPTESVVATNRPTPTESAVATSRSAPANSAVTTNRPVPTEGAATTTRSAQAESAPPVNRSTAMAAEKPAPTNNAAKAATTARTTTTETTTTTNKPAPTESVSAANGTMPAENAAPSSRPALSIVPLEEFDDAIAADEPAMTDNAIDIIAADEPAVIEKTDNAIAADRPEVTNTEAQPEPRISSGTVSLIPAEERVPVAPEEPATAAPNAAPENGAPAVAVTRTPMPQEAPPPAYAPPAEFSPFQAPLINSLEQGKWYVQVGVYSRPDNVEDEISRIGTAYPVAIQNIGTDTSPMFRVLLGPLNQGESGAMLQRFKSIGYADAFVRHN